ncbi:MAG: sulfite exporter TauE/SafE family protein [Methylomonas sp.]
MFLTLSLSIIIGLLLGLLGGGGSILTVPMLVYLLKVDPKTAITTAFVVVGSASLIALIPHAKRSAVCWKSGLSFGLAGMLGAFSSGRLATHLPNEALMTLFGFISLIIGILMLRGLKVQASTSAINIRVCPLKLPFLRLLFDGFAVGCLTGMVGVGGGFMIVPALTLLVGLPMQGAIGTSLLIIAMNALAGLIGFSQNMTLDTELTLIVTTGSLIGSLFGGHLSSYIKPQLLKRSFGGLVILVACYVLAQTINLELLHSFSQWLLNAQSWTGFSIGVISLIAWLVFGLWLHQIDDVLFSEPKDVD